MIKEQLVKSILNLDGNAIKNIADPVEPKDAVNKEFLEKKLSESSLKDSVSSIVKDNTLVPQKTLDPQVRYIVLNKDNLHPDFGTIVGLGNNDIVTWNGTSFVLDEDVSLTPKAYIVVFVEDIEEFYQYSKVDDEWEPILGLNDIALGEGLIVENNSIKIDNTVVQKKEFLIGNGTDSTFSLMHNFESSTVSVTIKDTVTNQQISTLVEYVSINEISLSFNPIPSLKQFKVIIEG